ncbi:nucleotidyl transferase AbiEii/AbiGii toxin family protein [Allopusillimonas ginsengisoli]|nr:nucleotidyl transferase AbiEii/AbiGii toxin family protein [Allopusillimonas ginsengisoli]
MAEPFFSLHRQDQGEALEAVRALTGRPVHLLEKDVWVVWALSALFDTKLGKALTFKGGTALSKAFKVIDRLSEDIDLTYDISHLIGELAGNSDGLPITRCQASEWTSAVRQRLPTWIESTIIPILESAMVKDRLSGRLELVGENRDKLLLSYPPIGLGTGYVAPAVVLKFGAHLTGEAHQMVPITCDMNGHLSGILFPSAHAQVMGVSCTFWEKATTAHLYCLKGSLRGERYARHWYDLAALSRSEFFEPAIRDRDVAVAVARNKSLFSIEKDWNGEDIDYARAVDGHLRIVPDGKALTALATDYAAMIEDQVMLGDAPGFETLMQTCRQVEALANHAAYTTTGGMA